MKNIMKKAVATLLVLVMLSSTLLCFAADLDQNEVNEHRGQFKNYVLLGDSVASGYRDVMCDEDDAYNKAYQETAYCRVPGSYADVLTKAIIEDNTMTAFAGPGYRTVEIRYMLEDDFDETDEYMFHPAQLNAVGDAGSEEYRAAYKKAVAEADLITLGVGGNDWGAYLGWVITDILERENAADKYIAQIKDITADCTMDIGMIEQLVEVAHLAGALPELISTIPSALSSGLGNFYKNWDIMIQDIYDLNPDVTLMVIGMSDNSVKGKYFGYNGEEGEAISTDPATQSEVVKTIVDFIMTVGNTPMIEGAKKFGYTYVDTKGATYVESHPDADGHVYIANKIIEALPCADFPYEDVELGSVTYKAIEYMYENGIMSGTSETAFSPDANLTRAQLAEALYNIAGAPDVSEVEVSLTDVDDSNLSKDAIVWAVDNGVLKTSLSGKFNPDNKVTVLDFASAILHASCADGFDAVKFITTFIYSIGIIADAGLSGLVGSISRAEAAERLVDYCKL